MTNRKCNVFQNYHFRPDQNYHLGPKNQSPEIPAFWLRSAGRLVVLYSNRSFASNGSFGPPPCGRADSGRVDLRSLRAALFPGWGCRSLHSASAGSLRSAHDTPSPGIPLCYVHSDQPSLRFPPSPTAPDQNYRFRLKLRFPSKTTSRPASLRQNAGIP